MKVKKLLQKWVINNIGYKILAMVFAFILWLVIINIQDLESTKTFSNIPVVILNEQMLDAGEYVYSVVSGETATVVVRGKRSIVDSLSTSDFYATADFAELSITNAVPITVTLTGSKAGYASSLTITQKTMSMILSLDDIVTKSFAVDLNYVGSFRDDMELETVDISPSDIEITAPRTVLENIAKVEANISVDDIGDGVTLRATPVIYNSNGGVVEVTEDGEFSINTDEVNVTFGCSYTKTVELEADYLGSPADGYEVTGVTYSFNTVALRGGEYELSKINSIKIPNTKLAISGMTDDATFIVDVRDYLPAGVEINDNNYNVIIVVSIDKSQEQTTQESESSDESEETTAETESTSEAETETTADKE